MFSTPILLSGMPRSGTSWLGQIFDSHPAVRFKLSPLFSYDFKNQLSLASSSSDWSDLWQAAYERRSDFMNQSDRRQSGEYPTFSEKLADPPFFVIKDTRFHELTRSALIHLPDLYVIVIVRHPAGAIHSWLTSPGEFPATADPMKEWRSGSCRKTGFGEFWGFDDWKKVTLLQLELMKDFPDRVKLLRYEDLVKQPKRTTAKLFNFVGLNASPQTAEFLHRSQTTHIPTEYSVFKKPEVAQRWRAEFQPDILTKINREVMGTPLERFVE